VDISPEQTWRASRHAKEARLDDVPSFRTADACQALREGDGQYDVVLALNSLHHFGQAADEQALSRLGHDFTYAVCSALAAPAPAARTGLRRHPARPRYDIT
jgi:hypothetical protein